LKLFRRLETGTNPDLEIGHFLTEATDFAHIPGVAGALEYHPTGAPEAVTLAILQGFVPNQGDAWRYTLESLANYFEQVVSQSEEGAQEVTLPQTPLLDLAQQDIPASVPKIVGSYLESAQLLGRRTAELHLALASGSNVPDFAPESFTQLYQHLLHQRMGSLTKHVMQLLRPRLPKLPEAARAEAQQVLEAETTLLKRFQPFVEQNITALRTRIHGDYHLGQVLYTGQDFMIIDFEGEPARTLEERRLKRSPWQDVAGMLRSFHYAAYAALFKRLEDGTVSAEEKTRLEAWARFWHLWVSVAFLKTYLTVTKGATFRAKSPGEWKTLLDAYLLEKAVYELGYELNNRPDWVQIPLQGILQTLQSEG
jgi:maltose alpha-D-glucosyltransferase/alpha-amylase